MTDNRSPLERLAKIGWDALDAARKAQSMSIEEVAQNARDAIETARRGLVEDTSLKQYRFIAPSDNAVTARVDLGLSVGESGVSALDTTTKNLVDADLHYLGSLAFGVSGDVNRDVFLRQSTPLTIGWANPIHWASRPRWDIGLSPTVPLDLAVQAGVGEADLDLSGLKLASLRLDGNLGPINLTLPIGDTLFDAAIRGGAGPVALNVAQGATGAVRVRGGVGIFALTVAEGAAVRVHIERGVGAINVPSNFVRVEKDDMFARTWQTPDYEITRRRADIYFADGVGNITVKTARV